VNREEETMEGRCTGRKKQWKEGAQGGTNNGRKVHREEETMEGRCTGRNKQWKEGAQGGRE
jgi:hypothetical protein